MFEKLIGNIEKRYGQGSLIRLGDSQVLEIERFSTGSIEIDRVLGGGIPKGRIVEIYGPESSGKTMLASHIVANAQAEGVDCLYIDNEHALNIPYMRDVIGVNTDDLWLSQPSSAEEALEIVGSVVEDTKDTLVVLDSVAALTPRAEIEGDMGDAHVGLIARLMSQALRKITAQAQQNNVTVIFINQLRAIIGGFGYGPTETTTGGKALRYFASQRIEIRRTASIKQGEEIIGHKANVKVVKNKVGPPLRVGKIDILYSKGISNESAIVDAAIDSGALLKKGAWIIDAETGETLAQGKQKLVELIEQDNDLRDRLTELIRQNQK